MYLVTSNQAKYKEFFSILDSLQIQIISPKYPIIEPQGISLEEVARKKVEFAFDQFHSEVMIDEAGLELKAFPGFPGPMTRFVLDTLGEKGLRELTQTDNRATMYCVVAYTNGIQTLTWKGKSIGHLDFNIPVDSREPGPLASWFVNKDGKCAHRAQALLSFQSYYKK